MDFFKCHLCNVPFDSGVHTPRMMPDCGHTFCQKCIQQRIVQGAVVCPEDDSTYEDNNLNDFPVNTTLLQILQRNATAKKTTQQPIVEYRSLQKPEPQQAQLEFVPVDSTTHDNEIPLFSHKRNSKSQLNKSFDAPATWRRDEEEELKRLLTPSDFLKNLLGSLHEQQDTKVSSFKNDNPQQSVNPSVPSQIINSLPVQHPIQKQHFNADALEAIVNEKENEFKLSINQKFDQLAAKLNERKMQVLSEVHAIYQKIYQGLNASLMRNKQHSQAEIKSQVSLVADKVKVDYQLQLELMIPRYCTVRNNIDTLDYVLPPSKGSEPDLKTVEQKTPAFAPQTKLFESQSEEEFHHRPHELIKTKNTPTVRHATEPDESAFLTFENDNNQFMTPFKDEIRIPQSRQQPRHQNYNIPYDITNQRIPTFTDPVKPTKQAVSPPKRIFDDTPTSPLLRAKQPLFTNSKQGLSPSNQPSTERFVDKVIDRLQKGVNVEIINLKDQGIGDKDVYNLAEAIKQTISFVRTVKLSRNLITNDGFKYLLEGIRKNRTIKTLNLKRNKLNEKALLILHNEYQPSKTNYLSQVFLKGNSIDATTHQADLSKIQHLGILIYM